MAYQGIPQQEVPMGTQYEVPPSAFMPEAPLMHEGPAGYTGVSENIQHNWQHLYGSNVAPPIWESLGDSSRGLQTHFDPLQVDLQNKLARKFSPKHQFWHLLEKVAVRLLWTILLSAAMIGCFKYFENVKVLTNIEKNVFNTLSTMIYLTIGLNLAGAFKGMATMLRWKLLARKPHNLKELDYILGLNSLMKVARLGLNALGFGKPMVFTACFFWILLNMVARVSVAFTGLTYSYDSANATSTMPGTVHISDKTRFWPLGYVTDTIPEPGAEFQTAHFYGEYSAMLPDSLMPGYPVSKQVLRYDNATHEWEYTFREWDPNNRDLWAETDRKIRTRATCEAYEIYEGQDASSPDVTFYNHTDGNSYTLTNIMTRGPGATVWANPRADLSNEPYWTCALGPRCVILAGFQFIAKELGDSGNGTLFQCAVSVGNVTNPAIEEHKISDYIAWVAAGAIGLDGFSNDPNGWLYQRYFLGTNFGRRVDGNPEEMAMMVARFAAGVIATLDIDNPRIRAHGMKPWVGVLFKVLWPQLLTILGSISAVQLILGLATVFYSNTVIVKDDSYLSTARLLRPLVERLGPSGCALTGKEIAATLKSSMVYGVRVDEKGTRHHLDIGEDIRPLDKFPTGWYDGEVEGMVAYTGEPKNVEKDVDLLA